ncbi:PQQ-binding-like beta-propeller repeat protein [Gemmata obscuriglobus]|uniref:Polyvinylalcohol dehydrogenase n=1 Tax=Gemmata obscuriglobus TaxID=114 RepID=A0A2Z3GRQ9_9BACT|nr:PQQ-binding-like beta-propeller repeat protein [Gemmata obscuriglobus]AWM36008.1 polyvinylalcohol dehydrogenase [Gemmata obscuriglobus]
MRLLVCAFLIGATATGSVSADWPGFRGPNRDGVSPETGLLKTWPEGGPKVLWTAKNLGLGWGTPSVADGVIYGVGTRDDKDGVWAVKESDGSELWFSPFAAPAEDLLTQTNGPASTPTVHKGKVYTVSANGTVSCLNAKDGKSVWTKNYQKDFGGAPGGKAGVAWGYSDSVLADGDKIICIPGAKGAAVAALNADTGATIWKTDAGEIGNPKVKGFPGQGYSSPVKATIGGVPQYIALLGSGSGVVGVSPDSGKVLWQYKGVGATGGVAQIPIPVVRGDLVWVSCSYGETTCGAALLQIVPKGGGFEVKPLKVHNKKQLNNHHGGMVLAGDYIYFGHDQNGGYPVCVEFKTGEIKWGPEKPPAGGQRSAAVLYADGRLYFRYENGVLVLIEPSPDELKVVSAFKLPTADQKSYPQSWPHPVIVNGKLLIRDQTVMYCYDVKAK